MTDTHTITERSKNNIAPAVGDKEADRSILPASGKASPSSEAAGVEGEEEAPTKTTGERSNLRPRCGICTQLY